MVACYYYFRFKTSFSFEKESLLGYAAKISFSHILFSNCSETVKISSSYTKCLQKPWTCKTNLRPNKENFLFNVHPSQFFQVVRVVGFFFFFFFCIEAYLVFIIQWGTSLHLYLSDYETTIPLFTMKPTTTRKKESLKSLVLPCIQLNLHHVKYSTVHCHCG